jgi:hypothetical protein
MSGPRVAGAFRWTRVCAVSRTERVFRAAASVFLAAFSLSMTDNLWCAIPAGVCSALLMVGAVTGWCPSNLLPRRIDDTAPNTLGIPESRQRIDV